MIKLDKRLSLIASFVRTNSVVADIGTDHAYIPAYLLQNGIIPFAYACDINAGPLKNAEETLISAGVMNKAKTVLGNGLQALSRNCANEIIIAGMGGILIAEILDAAPWVKNKNIHLVLQPMTHAEKAREYLLKNGFFIEKESVCCVSTHNYCVISAYYNEMKMTHEEGYLYYGEIKGKSDEERRYLNGIYRSLLKKYSALKMSIGESEEVENLRKILDDFERKHNVQGE